MTVAVAGDFVEKLDWIDRNGSERLKKCVKLGISYYDGIYRDERLRAELGVYARWARDDDRESEIINPQLEELEVLETVRALHPQAQLLKLRSRGRDWIAAVRVVVPWAGNKVAYVAIVDDN